MIPTRENDHAGSAIALLTEQFKGRRVIEGIIRALLKPLQDLEGTMWDIIEQRLLTNAVGVQLDILGDLVGETRQSRGDVDYKAAVRLRIRVNRSTGRAVDIIDVAVLAAAGGGSNLVYYHEYYPAAFLVTIIALSGANAVAKLIGQTRAAGVRGILQHSVSPTNNFLWGSTTGTVAGASVWGSTTGAPTGPLWLSAQETNPR